MERYEQARDALVSRLLELEPLLAQDERARVEGARARLQRAGFVLAVVGEFSSGKSFLLNTLLEKYRYDEVGGQRRIAGLLATDINPSTATVTELKYGTEERAYAYHDDGREERIPLDRLSRFIAVAGSTVDAGAIHDATGDDASAPARVCVEVDSQFLRRGFVVADTPGLASLNPAHRRVTLQFLPTADAVLYLIDTQQPFSEGDAAFLGIIRQHIESIFIVQTKIDLWQHAENGVAEWQRAYDRITQLAAVHAPGTYVYPLSAREYVIGRLDDDDTAIERSRFVPFLQALDASLVATTGRGRLTRARDEARAGAERTLVQIERDLALLQMPADELEALHARRVPELAQTEAAAKNLRVEVQVASARRAKALELQADQLADDAERALAQAFDTADVARIRDRARLHVLVDRTLSAVVGEIGEEIASQVRDDLAEFSQRGTRLVPLRFSLEERAARRFGAEPGTGIWANDVCSAIAASIVLRAIGGPAISLVHDISRRFAARRSGDYMKRELIADLRDDIFPQLRAEIAAYMGEIAQPLDALYADLDDAIASALDTEHDAQVTSIERALDVLRSGNAPEEQVSLASQRAAIDASLRRIEDAVDPFLAREREMPAAGTGSETVRRAHVAAEFDREAYGRGLRPQRYRVAVLGALRRGKSSLINTFAGRRVLGDEAAGALAFPVHVRYAEKEGAYALERGGEWREIEIELALQEATANPVLITMPWKLPHELVLVHAPAFDTGEPAAEDLSIVAADAASEVLCLFSRQLSDRELSLYERVAELGKPMLFVHTLADNETAAERRHVVELAKQYLQEHKIDAQRIFTVSTLEYAQAKRDGRAPAGWNEVDALVATIESHAEAHMARLARLQRAASDETEPRPADVPPTPAPTKRTLWQRLLSR